MPLGGGKGKGKWSLAEMGVGGRRWWQDRDGSREEGRLVGGGRLGGRGRCGGWVGGVVAGFEGSGRDADHGIAAVGAVGITAESKKSAAAGDQGAAGERGWGGGWRVVGGAGTRISGKERRTARAMRDASARGWE